MKGSVRETLIWFVSKVVRFGVDRDKFEWDRLSANLMFARIFF